MKLKLILILIILTACSELGQRSDSSDPVVAKAYGNELRLSEARKILPRNISEQDSAMMVQNFINKWIQQEILLYHAKKILSVEEQDFTRQLEEYRNSLLLYSYERKLISMHLDTIVFDEEIEHYYESNRGQFELRGNIVKFDFVKVPENSRQVREFRRLLQSSSKSDSAKLVEYCEKYSTDYWLTEEWIFLEELLDNIPLEMENQESFLRRTIFTEVEEDDFIYFLRINDFKTTDSIPPLAFERENIRNIIINSRKLDLLEKFRQQHIEEAYSNKDAEIF